MRLSTKSSEALRTHNRRKRRTRATTLLSCLAALAVFSLGCQPAGPRPPTSTSEPKSTVERDDWSLVRYQGAQAGYVHTAAEQVVEDGQTLRRTEMLTQLVGTRYGEQTEQSIRLESFETLDGRLVRFTTRGDLGGAPMTTVGRVDGAQLHIESTTSGKTVATSIAWPGDIGGFFAVEQSLRAKPMQPGERRALKTLLPVFNQVAAVELTAAEVESVELVGESKPLLRIEESTVLDGGVRFDSVAWADPQGEVLKTAMPALGQEIIRTTRETALKEPNSAEDFDLGFDTMVRLDRSLENPHQTRRARYRVRLAGQNPAKVFASSAWQSVTSTGSDTAEIIVRAARPDAPLGEPTIGPATPPSEADLAASNLIQSDAPRIISLAAQAAGDETDPWRLAIALEQFVHQYIDEVNFSQAMASAADVAESRQGDCTEHAVLLAALARARDLPARVAIGLVYTESSRGTGFAYHMWNELYLGDRWIPMDATLGRGGVGAAHLKLADADLAGAGALASLLPVIEVIGRLSIEIVEVEP